MKIELDINLFATLIECIEKQAILDKQTPEVQAQWTAVINETHAVAKSALNRVLTTTGNGDPRRTETGMGPMFSPDNTPYL